MWAPKGRRGPGRLGRPAPLFPPRREVVCETTIFFHEPSAPTSSPGRAPDVGALPVRLGVAVPHVVVTHSASLCRDRGDCGRGERGNPSERGKSGNGDGRGRLAG